MSQIRPAIKKNLFAVTGPTHKNFIGHHEKYCFFLYLLCPDLVIVFLLSFPSRKTQFISGIFPVKQRTVKMKMNRNKCTFFLNFKLKNVFSIQTLIKNNNLPTDQPIHQMSQVTANKLLFNSAPDNIRTAVNYGSGSSKYGSIVKTASTKYGRFLVGTVQLFR